MGDNYKFPTENLGFLSVVHPQTAIHPHSYNHTNLWSATLQFFTLCKKCRICGTLNFWHANNINIVQTKSSFVL